MENRVTRRYATALYDVARKQGSLQRTAADVQLLDDTFRNHPELIRVLRNPQVETSRRKAILSDLFGPRVDPLTLHFAQLLVDKDRLDVFEGLRAEFQRLSDQAEGILRARVQTAVSLTPDQEQKLEAQLARMTGKRVILTMALDSAMLGGARVWIGDRVIDGSVKGYLQSIEVRLTQGRAA